MTSQRVASPLAPIYRLVVTASQLKPKQFIWMIVYSRPKGHFGRDKTRSTNPEVDLAQPAPVKKATQKVEMPGAP
jgi:hypothetical protein